MARPNEYAYYVASTLSRFERLAALYPGVVIDAAGGHADTSWLPALPALAERTVHPVEAIQRWLDPHDDLDDQRLLIAMFVALRALDDCFADIPTRYEVTEVGALAVGARTWAPAGRSAGQWPFPHLRWVALRDSELYPFESAPACGFERAREAGVLRVGACGLPRTRTRFEPTRELASGHGLRAVDVSTEGAPEDDVLAGLAWARERGVHVLVFPELSVGPAQLDALRRELVRDPGALEVIVPGSFHVPAEGYRRYLRPDAPGHYNRAPVWLVAGGELVEWSYVEKAVPCVVSASPDAHGEGMRAVAEVARGIAVEDIRAGGALRLLPTGLGVFGFAVGQDVFTSAAVGSVCERYAGFVDFLIVVSHASEPSVDGGVLSRWHGGVTVRVNAVNAVADADDVAVDIASATWPAADAAGITGRAYYRGASSGARSAAIERVQLPDDGCAVFEVPVSSRPVLRLERGIDWLP